MASACVNNVGMSSENFLDCSSSVPCHSYGWLSPRISFSRDFPDDSPPSSNLVGPLSKPKPATNPAGESEIRDPDPELVPVSEFEFRLQDPVSLMLPADELFLDGKLVPLQVSSVKPSVNGLKSTRCVSSPDTAAQSRRRVEEECSTDPYLFSPKAPRCSSRWRELLGLKKLYQSSSNGNGNGGAKNENHKTTTTSSSYFSEANSKALKYFLHRSSKSSLSSSLDSSLSLPLLKDSDSESVSLSSSRVSLSSSSSGHEHEDLHRLSLDCENKPNTNPISLHRNPNHHNPPRMRLVKPRPKSESNPRSTSTADHHPAATRVGRSPIRRTPGESSSSSRLGIRGVSVDSPRMNSSGKIVFHNLERSSSSPSSFNGGPKFKNRGMERSYSANVRVTPVLNVPVCSSLRGSSKSVSVFGFGPLFTGSGGGGSSSRNHQSSSSGSNNSSNRTTTRRINETDGGGKIH